MTGITFQGVQRDFGRHTLLHGIDLDLAAGERIAILGDNGTGKTTLLRMAAGLLRPTQGRVERDGVALTRPVARKGLAFVDQDAAVYAELTVREHLDWWGDVHGVEIDADHWLDDAGLRRLGNETAASLSRGQRQRLRLAMAFAQRPGLLILDEPTTALDAAGRQWLIGHLAASPAAMLIATHEPDLVAELGATSRTLQGGRLA